MRGTADASNTAGAASIAGSPEKYTIQQGRAIHEGQHNEKLRNEEIQKNHSIVDSGGYVRQYDECGVGGGGND